MSEHPPNPDLGDAIVRRSPEEVDAYLAVNLAALGARVQVLTARCAEMEVAIVAMSRVQDELVQRVVELMPDDADPPVLWMGER